ncbi:MAG: DUF2309 domain-containing protein [Reinekea sp.]|nr:DUF2309 domain-containing protein [Reinekea sp.]
MTTAMTLAATVISSENKASGLTTLTASQRQRLAVASGNIAPSWPLDQMIAVNPFWPMRDQRIEVVAAQMTALAGVNLLMPRSYFQDLYRRGEISSSCLLQAAEDMGIAMTEDELVHALRVAEPEAQWHTIADFLDHQRDPHKMAWNDEITHQISQFCAAHYQAQRPILGRGQISDQPDLYRHWLDVTRHDRGLSIIVDEPGLNRLFGELPDDAETLLAQAMAELDVDDQTVAPYAHSLLLSINGWASWVAYLRWQGELHAQPRDEMLALLAIRMAWELVMWRYFQRNYPARFKQLTGLWSQAKQQLPDLLSDHERVQRPLWVWAKAAEFSYQQRLNNRLLAAEPQRQMSPSLQAAFCIDVRSEVMRRALEAQSDEIQTLGFAGFFGLPLEYQPKAGALSRPQLPGLLKPSIRVTEVAQATGDTRALNTRARWQTWSQAAPSAFSMVESTGWWYAFKLLKKSFFPSAEDNPVSQLSHQPNWTLTQQEQPLTVQAKAELVHGVLTAMGLREFAETVMLVGHGSHTTNNLHAAGLDCGACGGQTGEVNVRVLAHLLNDLDVRRALIPLGIIIPAQTTFVAALHNTTTDEIRCFTDTLSDNHKDWLAAAAKQARRERVARLDASLSDADDRQIQQAIEQRSTDWSQIRPEWGLANNAAFIVAPRDRTRGIDLEGRSFLHDYDWQRDSDFTILEAIMTAPMVVTNWINMQYNASVTDNRKFGSGNKLLHNAVAGHIGVFEGNGGDLRIGLAMQSVHDGQQWMHQPQRLAVYIAAPREPIERITAKHDNVRHLVDNEWLYLLRWSDDQRIERYYQGQWTSQA